MTMILTSSLKPGAQVRKNDADASTDAGPKTDAGAKANAEPKKDAEPKTPKNVEAVPATVVPPVVTAGSDAPAAANTGG
jgi:hypothetical protein